MRATVGLLVLAVVGVQPQFPTHWVTPDGSATGSCPYETPCSLTRAVALIGTASLPAGSTVVVQYGVDGLYNQALLTFARSGTATAPITFRFEDGVRLTGTRTQPTGWQLVSGLSYTYRVPWDEVASFTVTSMAQRPPAPTWQPIVIDDRVPPFTTSLGRMFSLEFPILYGVRTSVAQVEAQSCTVWDDAVNNWLYVHPCQDRAPTDADRLYAVGYQRGAIVINGSYLHLDNLVLEQIPGTALKVNRSAVGTVLTHLTARAAQVWLDGTGTLAEDLDVSHVIVQGAYPDTECYDANPTFGRGECWNSQGDGRALLIGKEGSVGGNQIVRRAKVHQSWNGARIDGRNMLDTATLWSFPNHTLEASGTGVVIRQSTFRNGQDSLFMKTNPFDDLTIEDNIFAGAVYITASNNGVGGVTPTNWLFYGNLIPVLILDRHAFLTLASDCNVYMGSGDPIRVITTNGVPGVSWPTLAAVQAATKLEPRSRSWPSSYWTAGRFFMDYTSQQAAVVDFRDPLAVCGKRVGPEVLP